MDNFNSHIDSIESNLLLLFFLINMAPYYMQRLVLIPTDACESHCIKESYFSRDKDLYIDPQAIKMQRTDYDCQAPIIHLQHNPYMEGSGKIMGQGSEIL